MVNIIGDIAGQYKTLLALLKQMPDEEPISVGDMIDKGPDSKSVLDFFMSHGRAIMGNHCHMMWDWYYHWREILGQPYYDYGIWYMNGGKATIASFGIEDMKTHVDWIRKLPKSIEIDNCLITHAFIDEGYQTLGQAMDLGTYALDYPKSSMNILWSRSPPIDREWDLQICGHNSQFGLKQWGVPPFAICLDASKQKFLTGLNLETDTIYQQPYIG